MRFATEDARRAHRALRAAGTAPHQEVLITEFAPPVSTAADPHGNTVILARQDDAGSGGPGR